MKLPSFIQIEPVGQCNLRCQMCPIQFRRDGPPHGPPAYMEFEAFTRILDQLPHLKELHLQGLGEPLMHRQFFDMVEYAVAKRICVSTNTNMTLLDRNGAERCVSSGLDTMHISVDAASPEIYERIRVGAKLQRVLQNIKMLVHVRKQKGSRKPKLRMITVVMRQNLQELPDLVALAHQLGIETMFVQHLSHDFQESTLPEYYKPMRDFVNEQTLLGEDPERIEWYFSKAWETARQKNVDLRLPNSRPIEHNPETPGPQRCDWPWKGPYLSYRGEAMPCCMVATPDRIHFGNMAEQGVEKIWNHPNYEVFRQRLSSDNPPEVCRSCSIYRGTF